MSRSFRARMAPRRAGRFVRHTLENTLGLTCTIHERKASGEWCGALNPSRVGEPRPIVCSYCGEPIPKALEVVD